MKRFYLIFISVSICFNLFSQYKHEIDSLKQLIAETEKNCSKPCASDTILMGAYIRWDELVYMRNMDSSIILNQKVVDIAEALIATDPAENVIKTSKNNLAGSYNNIGYIYDNRGEINKAIEYYEKSLNIYKEIGYKKGVALSQNNIGYVYNNQGNIAKALDYFSSSLKLHEEIGDKKGMGYLLTNIASIYEKQEDTTKALEYYHKSFELAKEIGDKKGIGFALNNIGLIHYNMFDFSKALDFFEKSLEIRKELGDKMAISTSLNNIGLVYRSMGDNEKAVEYYNAGLEIRNEINDKKGIVHSLVNLGNICLSENEINKALEYGEKSYNISKEMGFPAHIVRSAELLSKVYEKKGEYKKAYEFFTEMILMQDSIKNEENYKQAQKQQARYEYEKQKAIDDAIHDKQLAIEHKEKEKQKIISYAIACGLIMVVIFLIFIINRLRITRRQKRLIEEQKQLVEYQKTKVELAHDQLEEKNKEIMDSIQYAKTIQAAILPPLKIVKEYLKDSFILYKPKDIVAGDFYWMEHKDNKIIFAVADCTGHGVPGAMVSVICNNGLNRAVREHGLTDPGKILDKAKEIVIQEFEKSEEEVKDGMDIALCSIEENILQYAGAHNPLWIIRNGELIEIKADKQPIGKSRITNPFITQTIQLNKADTIYLFSDGYVDQFGGESGKKFKSKAFKELLLSIQNGSMEVQRTWLDENFENWRGKLEQIDDVCVIGVRV